MECQSNVTTSQSRMKFVNQELNELYFSWLWLLHYFPAVELAFLCSGLLCKVTAGNDVACLTTNHLAALAKLEPRLVPLVLAFRHWARVKPSPAERETQTRFGLILFLCFCSCSSCATLTARLKAASPHTRLPSWSFSSCSRGRSPSSLSTWVTG